MKRIIALLLAFTLAFAFCACGSDQAGGTEENGEAEGGIVGGWARAESPVITDELKAIFDKAFEGMDGAEHVPVAYLASQLVSGTNHLFLVRTTPVVQNPVEVYNLVTIYQDLEGNVEILDIKETGIETNINGLMGGWEPAESPELTDELREAFDKAKESLTGADYEPVALAATQVVAGMNYCILCESTLRDVDPEKSYALGYMYVDLEGNSEITDLVSLEAPTDEEASETSN